MTGIPGHMGPEGNPGETGPDGPPGQKGEKGQAGEYGIMGIKGDRVSINFGWAKKRSLLGRKYCSLFFWPKA